ncbi:hypothetical protein E1B28_010678 [Marasmius oreades]|uniref:Ubiquitin-like protease family profile domain-containing protein n=1 Tax=Marasmius oreades TaxID=181124 RepID=A0A9P7RY97_9AGAR|nr:uncharacterized protein E1B28_010678 [Marasmius oreades]KAG7091657.1 hypothetical protein E1B28_010678 [Marasmius oreades]
MPFGTVVRSPGKKRMKARADHYVSVPGNARKRAAIQSRLASLIATARAASSPLVNDGGRTQEEMVDIAEGEPGRDVGGVDQDGIAGRNGMDIDILEPADPDSFISYITGISTPSLNLPSSDNVSTTRLSDASLLNIRWKDLLPTLMDSFLVYRNKSVRRLDPLPLQFTRHCSTGTCKPRQSKVRCYTLCSYCDIVVPHCECLTLPQVLVQHGMFPASPSRLRTAFSIELLDLYHRLWQRSSDAITSFSSALIATYKYRGFSLYGEKGGEQHDPIRRPLSQAIQWYDCLAVMVERQVNNIIDTCISEGSAPSPTAHASGSSNLRAAVDTAPTPAALEPFGSGAPGPFEELSKDECAARLQRLCPCCFGGNKYGLSFDDGGDIHVALDGNLHHRQLASAGEGVPFYDSTRFLSKAFVDSVGERMAAARKKPPKPRNPKVPDEAIDQCRESYHAAKGDSKNAASDVFRERGLMGLVCRHDIPVLIASIDTPGEQQKYAIALFEALFSLIPNFATVLGLYDIGCVLDRSLEMYDFLPLECASRLRLATSVLHAYGHQWACQLKYNPRLRSGLGLTDGEGTERLWAALRKLIGPERQSSRERRKWLLDRCLDYVAEERQEDLGTWMTTRLYKNVQIKESEAKNDLEQVGIPVAELRQHWKEQRDAQTSVRSHAHLRLKKELNKVLQLQAEIDSLEETISATKTSIKHLPHVSPNALDTLSELESAHLSLKARAEDLYASLNIPEDFPDLKNIPFDFLRMLLIARDLKISIRKRSIRSFYEWQKLDRAVGGREFALGTKAHQLTRKSITKRTPALQSAIRKFNDLCDKLRKLHNSNYAVPVPKPLPTDLTALRDPERSYLWEDVWISRSDNDIAPRWLVDENVRKGIRAMLTLERCREERARLEHEARNMCKWYSQEQLSIEFACASAKLEVPDSPKSATAGSPGSGGPMDKSFRLPLTATWCFRTSDSATLQAVVDESVGEDVDELIEEFHDIGFVDAMADQYLAEVLDDVGEMSDDYAGEDNNGHASEDKIEEGHVHAKQEDSNNIAFDWLLPSGLQRDSSLLFLVKTFPQWRTAGDLSSIRELTSTITQMRYTFRSEMLDRIDGRTSRLCGDSINACAVLLQELISSDSSISGSALSSPDTAGKFAILSTYVTPKIFEEPGNQGVWRLARRSRYWCYEKWILPLHDREMEHWLLAVFCLKSRNIYLFDSFGSRVTVNAWVPKMYTILSSLVEAAQEHGHLQSVSKSNWTVRPFNDERLQSNGYDCGVWVLYTMTAILRGKTIPLTPEEEITGFRVWLSKMIRYLPCKVLEPSESPSSDSEIEMY